MLSKKRPTGGKFATARISENLAGTIDEFIKSGRAKQLGYRSRADFVTRAVRNYLEENVFPIDIPGEIIAEIDAVIEKKRHGYRSREEFIHDSIRRRLEELKPLR
jgi:metal-responsive CopG/Arc/MetJ family transcriptional regulator